MGRRGVGRRGRRGRVVNMGKKGKKKGKKKGEK
jgi:hypothetical protein